jgi:hypothetical protein
VVGPYILFVSTLIFRQVGGDDGCEEREKEIIIKESKLYC